jgi:hypothetical protein
MKDAFVARARGLQPVEVAHPLLAEVFADKDQLAGQPVVFRGKVVKTNPNIMGKNWLHVRDGSGAEGTNDLTVTTASGDAKMGDVVLVEGTAAADRDFGSGYRYEVLLEEIFEVSEHYDVDTQKLLSNMKLERDLLLRSPNFSPEKFIEIASKLATRSEELDGIVALELRQLAKHGRRVVLGEPTSKD